MESIRWIWGYMRKHKIQFSFGIFLALSVTFLNLLNPYFSGRIVDDVIKGNQSYLLWKLLGLMAAVTVCKTVIRYCYQMLFEKVSQSVVFVLRKEMYDKLNRLDFGFFDKTRTGDIMARMTGDMEAVRHFTAWAMYMIFENSMMLLLALCFMFYIHPPLALILLTVTPVIGYVAYRLSTDVQPTFTAIREQFSKLNSVVQENISGNRVVKAFGKEDYEIEKFLVQNGDFKEKNLISSRIWSKYLPVLDSLAGMLLVLMIFAGGTMVIQGSLTIGELVTFNSLLWALNNPMRMAGWLANDVQRFIASARKIQALLQTEPEIVNSPQAKVPQNLNGHVSFSNVSFSYGDEKVLENITFHVRPGQTVGIIGPTGSGKSTLMSLLCRFYDVTGGGIFVNGVNVKEWDVRKLREHIALVMQDVFLFSDTIEGNIAYGIPDASVEAVQIAAKKAEAHEFISRLPDGYDTIIGERGVGLSGGQRQRIALARAILKDAPFLILDDTTSAVDMETELCIQRTLRTVFQNKICFTIAHRISSVKDADLILVMEGGRITEQGTHEELLRKQGYYYKVYQNQFGNADSYVSGEGVV